MTYTQITAAILAGGKSRRMGSPKALLPYRGKPLAQHLLDALAPHVAEVVLAGTPEPDLYRDLSCRVLADPLPDSGPLGGMLAVMEYSPAPLVLCVPCDGVVLPADFVSRLMAALESKRVNLVYAKDSEREQPLYVLARTSLRDSLREYLDAGGRKVIDWFATQHYAVVDFSAHGFVFSNLNHPDDWQQFVSTHS